MFDLSKQKIDVKCKCGRAHSATLKDVMNQRTIRCSCGVNLQLQDSKGSVKNSVNDVNKSFKDLENTLKGLGR
jgi:hypothetical protein